VDLTGAERKRLRNLAIDDVAAAGPVGIQSDDRLEASGTHRLSWVFFLGLFPAFSVSSDRSGGRTGSRTVFSADAVRRREENYARRLELPIPSPPDILGCGEGRIPIWRETKTVSR
jgi:hypothetical protein